MSINILLGAPGSGKSYEAVAYHILPALQRGRKVITNLPVDVDYFELVVPGSRDLIEIRTKTLAAKPEPSYRNVFGFQRDISGASDWVDRPFAHAEDYLDEWRDKEGRGPMYVIDECHFVLPYGKTDSKVEEWFSMHRHYNVDVLLITQSYGKCSKAIIDLVQVCYKVRKATALGKNDGYVRKVLDGVRGGEISVTQRKYEKKYFPLYRSHTHGTALAEASPDDVSPLLVKFNRFKWAWLAFSFVCLVWAFWPSEKTKPGIVKPAPKNEARQSLNGPLTSMRAALNPASAASASASAPSFSEVETAPSVRDPLFNRGVHMTGDISMGVRRLITFVVSSNGRRIFSTNSEELSGAGYEVVYLAPCLAELIYEGSSRLVTCDAPYQQGNGNGDYPVVIDSATGGRSDARPAAAPGPAPAFDLVSPTDLASEYEYIEQTRPRPAAQRHITMQEVAAAYRGPPMGRVEPRLR